MLASLVDVDALWKIAVASFAAGAGTVVAWGVAVLATSRYAEVRAGERDAPAAVYASVAALAALVCAAVLVIGFLAMTKK